MSNAYVPAGFRARDTDSAIDGLAYGVDKMSVGGGRGMCAGCNAPISRGDRQFNIQGSSWHAKCFRCDSCDLPIDVRQDGGFVIKKGKNWCQKCDKYDARLNNDTSGQFVKVDAKLSGPSVEEAWGVTSQYVPDSGAGASSPPPPPVMNGGPPPGPPPVPSDVAGRSSRGSGAGGGVVSRNSGAGIQNRLDQGKENCSVCSQVITGTGYGAKGRWYHPDCFTCAKCGQLITDQRFVSDNNQVYHPDCAPPRGPPCAGCGQPLVGTYRIFQDGKYHAQCLVCAGCKGSLDSGYILKGSDPYCRECVMNPGSRPMGGGGGGGARSATSATPGIRFNHQTQQASAVGGGPPPAPHTISSSGPPAPPASISGGPPAPPPAAVSGGGKIPKFCGTCGAKTQPEGKFCGECGASFF